MNELARIRSDGGQGESEKAQDRMGGCCRAFVVQITEGL